MLCYAMLCYAMRAGAVPVDPLVVVVELVGLLLAVVAAVHIVESEARPNASSVRQRRRPARRPSKMKRRSRALRHSRRRVAMAPAVVLASRQGRARARACCAPTGYQKPPNRKRVWGIALRDVLNVDDGMHD